MAAADAEQSGLEQASGVGHRARAGLLRLLQAEARAEPAGEAVVARAVLVHRRLGLRPGTVEERQQAMVEDIEKAGQRRVAAEAKALAHVLRQVQRHRSLRAEQAEEADAQARCRFAAHLEALQRRRGEIELGILAEPQRFREWPQRFPEARQVRAQGLDASQHGKEVVLARCAPQRIEQPAELAFAVAHGGQRQRRLCALGHSASRMPMRGGQRITSPRCVVRSVSWVKLLIAAWRAKSAEHAR